MGHIRTDFSQRYECAALICSCLPGRHITYAGITARDISRFHDLSGTSPQSIAALLHFLYTNRIREPRFGLFIRGTTSLVKCDDPRHDTIELDDRAPGAALMTPDLPGIPGRITGPAHPFLPADAQEMQEEIR